MADLYPPKIQMRRVELLNDGLEVGDYWWGAWGWKHSSSLSAKIYIVFPPSPESKAKYSIHWAPCSIDGHNDAQDRQWNGDYNKPTIEGSWGIDHYHCYVIDGEMRLDKDG